MNLGARRDRLLAGEARRALETALFSAVGAGLFLLLGIPAAPILGALTAVAAASLAGRRLGYHPTIRTPQFVVMGIAAGAAVTPAALAAAATWPISIAALIVASAAMQGCGYLIFRRIGRLDRLTAFLAAAPGSLSAVLLLAEEGGADVPRVAVPQTLRVTGIVMLSPLLLTGAAMPPPLPAPGLIDGVAAWAALLASVFAGWRLARRLRWPLPAFMGPLAGSAALHAFGIVTVTLPAAITLVATAGLGGVIGSRFSGLRPRDVARLLPLSLLALASTAAIGLSAGVAVGNAIGVGSYPGMLAFAPGSMEMMIAVALTMNVQPAYVAAHHVTRTVLLLSIMPFLARWMGRACAGDAAAEANAG